jgi:hypothetical protein
VPLFVDIDPNLFGGPLVLLSQGRRMFDAAELDEALRTAIGVANPEALGHDFSEREIAALRALEDEYRRRPRINSALRRELLERLLKLILASKDAAQRARKDGALVTTELINLSWEERTVMKQLGEDDLPVELRNWRGQGQDAGWVMSRWQHAYDEVERMLLEATLS